MLRDDFETISASAHQRAVQLDHPYITFLAQKWHNQVALAAMVPALPDQMINDGLGFTVNFDQAGNAPYIRIVADGGGVPPLFLKLVEYVLERTSLAEDAADAHRLLPLAVEEFSKFFRRRPGRLSEEEIRGLTAELLLIQRMLEGEIPARDVFHAWGGPFGGVHDFVLGNGQSIEVKSTHQPPLEVRISTPEQTTPTPAGLDLMVLPLQRVTADTMGCVSFSGLVSEVAQIAAQSSVGCLDLWESAMRSLALDQADQYYNSWHFLPGIWQGYEVRNGFPSIDLANVPRGVVKVAFSLQLAALAEFAMHRDPNWL